jgi:hypothetical protein
MSPFQNLIEIRDGRISGRKNLEARRRSEFIDGWESGEERERAEAGERSSQTLRYSVPGDTRVIASACGFIRRRVKVNPENPETVICVHSFVKGDR